MKNKTDIFLELCLNSLEQYDKSISETAFIEDYFKISKIKDQKMQLKIAGIFHGCQKFMKILRYFVEGYSQWNTIRKTEYYYYIVLSYLLIIGTGVYDWEEIRDILCSQTPLKMNRFLNYFLNDNRMKLHIDEWKCIYDSDFIEKNITKNINKYLATLTALNSSLITSASHVEEVKEKREIKQKPFNLTKPSAPKIQIPFLIYPETKEEKHCEKTRINNMVKKIKNQKEINNQRITDISSELVSSKSVDKKPMIYSKRRRKTNILHTRISTQIPKSQQVKEEPKIEANAIKKRVQNKPEEIKQTTASVLREAQLYEKIREIEIQKITDLAAGNGDSTEYYKFVSLETVKMLESQRDKRNGLHEAVVEGRVRAIKALEEHKMDNEEIGSLIKAQKKQIKNEIYSNFVEKIKKTNELKQECDKAKEQAKEVKTELEHKNRQKKLADRLEFEQRQAEAARDRAEEMDRKHKLIAEIKLQESLAIVKMRSTTHDLTETGNHGLLNELSVVELRERLAILKEEKSTMLLEKGNQLRHQKLADKRMVEDKLQLINRYREVIASTGNRKF